MFCNIKKGYTLKIAVRLPAIPLQPRLRHPPSYSAKHACVQPDTSNGGFSPIKAKGLRMFTFNMSDPSFHQHLI